MTRLEQIRARLEAAKKGPWSLGQFSVADAKFITAAPTDIAYLLEEVARLRAALLEIECGIGCRQGWSGCDKHCVAIAREALKENPNG